MRMWAIFICELIVSLTLMAASFSWFPDPWNLVITLGVAVVSAILMAPHWAATLGGVLVDFIYGTNSRGLGEDYDYEKVDADYQMLWNIVLGVWYLVLFAALLTLAWCTLQFWEGIEDRSAFMAMVVLIVLCSLLWGHFLLLYFLPQLAHTHLRWVDRMRMKQVDREAEAAEAEARTREERHKELVEAGRPRREQRDPFYREPREPGSA